MAKKNISAQIVVQPPQRTSLDVGLWRQALMSADKDRVKQLYNLYDDVLIDGTLSDAIQKRIDAITNTPLSFINEDDEEVTEISDLMDTSDWEELLTLIMRTKFWGRTAMEFDFTNGFKCTEIVGKHINLVKKTILIKDSDTEGISYENDPFILVLGKRRDFGLLLKAAPYVIYKRGGFGDWAQWIELFGMPQRIGKYNIHDPESKQQLEDAFAAAGAAPYLIVPEDVSIEKAETSSGNGVAYDDFRKACNEEILITILGQTMTTVQGDRGARSLGEVHQDVEASKHKSDLRYVQRILNQQIKPRLEAMGYPVSGGRFVYPEVAEHLEVGDIMQLSEIMDIPKAWLHKKYAIPMAQEGEAIARRVPAPMFPVSTEEIGNDIEDVSIANTDASYTAPTPSHAWKLYDRIMRFFGYAPSLALGATTKKASQLTKRITPTGCMASGMTLADVSADAISLRFIERIATRETTFFDPELFEWIAINLSNAVKKAFGRSSVAMGDLSPELAYSLHNDALATALEVNLYRFSLGKTLKEVQLINEAFRKEKSFDKFMERAKGITKRFNERWQRTEYDTAVLMAESTLKYHELQRKTHLFPYWKYRTLLDDRVRLEHKTLDGLILPADDQIWDEIYPPNGWNCRCSVEPVMAHEAKGVDLSAMRQRVADYKKTGDWETAQKHGFDGNRAKAAVIFDKNQQYMDELNGEHIPYNKLHHEAYGLPPVDQMLQESTSHLQLITTDRETLWNQYAGANTDTMVITDYEGRKVFMPKKNFDEHTDPDSPKYAYRAGLFQAAIETLKNPDEVWVNRQKSEQVEKYYEEYKKGKKYARNRRGGDTKIEDQIAQNGLSLIRYYKGVIDDEGHQDDLGTMMVVRYRITDIGLQLVTWFEVTQESKYIDNLRNGLLVKRKSKKYRPHTEITKAKERKRRERKKQEASKKKQGKR